MQNDKTLIYLTIVLVILTAVLLCATILYANESRNYAGISQLYANQSANQLQNITQLNQEIIGWYKNPEPILINITNLFSNNTALIRKYDNSTSLEKVIEDSSEIQIKLRNVGRNNANNLMMYIDFNVFSYGQTVGKPPEPEYPYPFKIYSINTTPSTQTIQYNIDEKYTTQNDIIILCSDENGFYPSINCSNITIGIGSIEIDQEKIIHIKLFSLNAAFGNMDIRIMDERGEQLQRMVINLEAMTFY